MINIKKDRDIKFLVFALFVLTFLTFLYFNPGITGNAVSIPSISITDINVNNPINSNDDLGLNFASDDIYPCNSSIILNISLSNVQTYYESITLGTFLSRLSSPISCSSNFSAGSAGAFLTGKLTTIYNDIGNFVSPGTYDFVLKFNRDGVLENTQSTTFEVLSGSTSTPSSIGSITFESTNSSNRFKVDQIINCSATITDSDSSSVSVSYTFWGGDDFNSNYGNGQMSCTGTSWASGKVCEISSTITTSNLGDWYCTIKAQDESNIVYENSSSIEMKNSPPVLDEIIENITWEMNTNYTNLDLGDYFSDPDDDELTFSVSGNKSVNVDIDSNGDVEFIPLVDWYGNETIYFTAEDSNGASTDSNTIMINVSQTSLCEPSYSCTEWTTECINGNQTRVCDDLNNCTVPSYIVDTVRSCENVLTATCSSGDLCKTGCPEGDGDCSCELQGGFLCGSSMSCGASSLQHSGSGICCSIACTSVLNSGVNAGSSGIFGTDTSGIVKGVGVVAGIVFIITTVIILVIFFRRKNAKMQTGANEQSNKTVNPDNKPVNAGVKQTKPAEGSVIKPLMSKPVKVKPVNFEKMQEYIKKSLRTKVPLRVIKSELQKTGWSEKDIDNEISMQRLKEYVKIKVNQGVPKKDIEYSLRMKGWKPKQIKEVMEDAELRPLF